MAGLDAGEEETPEQARERIRALDALPIPEYFKELSRTATSPKSLLKYPLPKVLSRDRFAWTRDGEFARQTLAGVNPVAISCVEVSQSCACGSVHGGHLYDLSEYAIFDRDVAV